MKRHVNNREFSDLHTAITNWAIAREQQAVAVDRVIDILECDADEAVDLLNAHSSGCELADRKGIEVHSEGLSEMPWIDGETLLVWGLIVTGFAWAVVHSGLAA